MLFNLPDMMILPFFYRYQFYKNGLLECLFNGESDPI